VVPGHPDKGLSKIDFEKGSQEVLIGSKYQK